MDLSIFKNIKDNLNNEDRKEVIVFLKELNDFIEKDDIKVDRNMIEKVENEKKIISKFRDKMLLERIDILNSYAMETSEKGNMYFIYDKNSTDINKYNMCLCNENDIYKVIEVSKNELPEGTEINSVLRVNNGRYILDKQSTDDLTIKIDEMIERLMEEQENFLQEYRIEGHVYKVDEKEEDRLWLIDITKNSNEAIEEIKISEEVLNNVNVGDKLKFNNGVYQFIGQ